MGIEKKIEQHYWRDQRSSMREGRNGIRWREVHSGSSVHGEGGS